MDQPSASWKKARKEFHDAFSVVLATNTEAQQMLARYRTDPQPFVAFIREFAAQWNGLYVDRTDDQLVQVATREAGRIARTMDSPALAAAFATFKIARASERNAKRNFLQENDMTKAYRDNPNQTYDSDGVKEMSVRRLKTAYPPRGKWVTETEEFHDLWHYHLRFDPKADSRLPRHEPIIIDPSKLQLVIDTKTSCIITDTKTEEIVLIVLRHCFSPDIGEWMDEIVEEATSTRRNIRRDDEGTLAMIGLSAGARSKPAFHWVRNLLRKFTDEQIANFDKKQCSVFAFFWNWLRCHLDKRVLNTFDNWMERDVMPRMTPEWKEMSKTGSYTVELPGSEPLKFNDVELAPPTGVMGSNYARAMHYEKQPHPYAVSFTTRRRAKVVDGGHFYIGSYGIKVEASANCTIAWRPKDVHGTSLQNRSPYDANPDYIQRGICIVTSSRLPAAWKKYAATLGIDLDAVDKEAKKAEKEIYAETDEIYT